MRLLPPSLCVLAPLLLGAAMPLGAQTLQARAADIEIGGRLHAQYQASSVDAAESDFFLRRARLTVDVTLTDRIDGRVQPEFAGGGASLKDAYLRVRFGPGLRVAMGQFKRSFDLFELASSTDLSIIERDGRVAGVDDCAGVGGVCSYSRLTEKLEFSDRDTGLRLDGAVGGVSWEATLTNGAGADARDVNDAKSYSGRVAVPLGSGVTLGGQLGLHDFVSVDDGNETAAAWAADLQYGDWRDGLLLQAAVVGGENWKAADATGDEPSFLAFQGVASRYVELDADGLVTAVEPLARLSFADPDTGFDDDAGLLFTPGVMLYLDGKTKFGANLDVYSPQAGDTEFSLKLQSFLYF